MVKAYIVDSRVDPNGRRRVQAVLQFGGQNESLNPRDVGLESIDSIILSPQSINTAAQAIPIGSVGLGLGINQGSPGPEGKIRGHGPGSSIILRWTAGSTGTRMAFRQGLGTASLGTKTAHAQIFGR